ncbi:c-binding -like [Pelobates cultripes]|uniref:C-binding -like n=1 Tax=Pelobates cultripes TaxID=61616 RepID=A0AAD1RJ47_PELCU|nr:c-binding -like [Pelobates cultripes]
MYSFEQINNIKSLLPVTLNNGTDSLMNIFQSGNKAIIQFTTDVMVSYDWNHVVRIELTRRYSRNVAGMCGNYNQDPADDFQMPSGSQAPNAIEFGKSWKMDNGADCWDDCSGPCLTCPPNVADKFKTDNYCGLIAKKDDGPFSACHAFVDPSTYMDNCVYDVCVNNGYKQLACQAIKDYADTCQQAGANITEWRETAGCRLNCPQNSTYILCGRACAPTCQDPTASSPCSELCVEQCQCDPGFVLIGGKCSSKENCGCFINGRSYAPHQSFWGDNTCSQKCICNGQSQKVECSKTSCRVGEECSVREGLQGCYPTTFGKCSTCSSTHYFTYDGGKHDLTGNCKYQLSALCDHSLGLTDFQVNIQNQKVANLNLSVVAKVEIEAYGTKIEISRQNANQVMVNGLMQNLPYSYKDGGITMYQNPNSMVIKTDYGLSVLYDWSWNVMVTLPSTYTRAVGGLCGNFDQNKDNNVTNERTSRASPAAFCNNWKQDAQCEDVDRPQCAGLAEKEQTQRDKGTECGILLDSRGPFHKCHTLVNPENYFKSCTYVSCILPNTQNSLCSALSAYTTACKVAGGTVQPWHSDTFCSLSCPPNSHYEECASDCPLTCNGLITLAGCDSTCSEGCVCDNGFVLSGALCTPLSQCGCVYNGAYYTLGETVYEEESCSKRCTCSNGGDMICSPNTCSPNEDCGLENGKWGCYPKGLAICTARGNLHYNNFDGRTYAFRGLCSYVMAQSCDNGMTGVRTSGDDFKVIAQHEKFVSSAAVVRLVTVEIYGYTIILTRKQKGTVQVNGTDYRLPVTLLSGKVRAEYYGQGVIVKSDYGIQVTFDLIYGVTVSVPNTYKGRTCGLCGNYNGNAIDDMGWTANEIDTFGEKWKVSDPSNSCSVGCGASDNPCPTCEGPKTEIFSRENYCGIMSSAIFGKCHSVISYSQYIKDCIYDLCQSDGDTSILCDNVATYAAACKDAGGPSIQWRTEDFCAMACPIHSHYSECPELCSTSCATLTDTYGCSKTCTEGCECDTGYLFDGTDCKPVEECGCFGNGRYYKLNETVLNEDCSYQCNCHPTLGLSCHHFACSEDEKCQILDGIRACINIGTCTYTLAKSTGEDTDLVPFRVEAKNDNRGDRAVSFVRMVTIALYDLVISIQTMEFGKVRENLSQTFESFKDAVNKEPAIQEKQPTKRRRNRSPSLSDISSGECSSSSPSDISSLVSGVEEGFPPEELKKCIKEVATAVREPEPTKSKKNLPSRRLPLQSRNSRFSGSQGTEHLAPSPGRVSYGKVRYRPCPADQGVVPGTLPDQLKLAALSLLNLSSAL